MTISKTSEVGVLRERVADRRGRNIGLVAAARLQLKLVFYALRDGHVLALGSRRGSAAGAHQANVPEHRQFYKDNHAEIDAAPVSTLDFLTGQETKRQHFRAKIIDMEFFQRGSSGS
jgi:hypothetical protein